MTVRSWIRRLFSRKSSPLRRHTPRLTLEWLEDRITPSTFTVSNLLDDGSTGSLRWAINQANSNPGADTIDFTPGMGRATIFDGTATITVPAVVRLSNSLAITGDLTIDGRDTWFPQDPVTLSGQGSVQIMVIAPGVNVHLDTLNFKDGNAAIRPGGAIANLGALTVTNCTFSNNAATMGGAIRNVGQLNISGSTFSNNQAQTGGAIWNANDITVPHQPPSVSQLTITNSTFTNNQAVGVNSQGIGGAIAVGGGIVTLDHVTLSGHTARGSAGSAGTPGKRPCLGFGCAPGEEATLEGSAGSAGANGYLGAGGGLAVFDGSVTVTDSTISGNNAQGGAGGAGGDGRRGIEWAPANYTQNGGT